MLSGHLNGLSEEMTGPYLRASRGREIPHREEKNQQSEERADERVEEERKELERLAEGADEVDGAIVNAAKSNGESETGEEACDDVVNGKQLRPKDNAVERPRDEEDNIDGEESVAKRNKSVETRREVAVRVLDFGLPFEQDITGRGVTERNENNVLSFLRHIPMEVDFLGRASRHHTRHWKQRKGDGLVLALANMCFVDNELVVLGAVPILVFRGGGNGHIESMTVTAIQTFLPLHNSDCLIDRIGKNHGLENDPEKFTSTSISPLPKR